MMKVFLSWSGDISKKVALTLRDWLPSVIQVVDPYVSSEDIDKGARWSSDIAKELSESSFGILCITPENLNAPWIHFEAGALSKALDKSFVCPFLLGIKRSEVKDVPILQFQSTIFEKEDIKKLVSTINSACQNGALEEARLERTFEVWWPKLETELKHLEDALNNNNIISNSEQYNTQPSKEITEILEELLELTRNQHKLLRSPEELLPPNYLRHVLGHPREHFRDDILFDLEKAYGAMKSIIEAYERQETIDVGDLNYVLLRLERPIRYLSHKIRENPRFAKKMNIHVIASE